MLIFRDLNSKDMKDIRQWWKDWKFPILPEIALSSNGYIVEDNKGNKICAAWMYYSSNSNMCVFGYPVANRKIDTEQTDKALDYLINSCKEEATIKGNHFFSTTTSNEKLAERLLKNGFQLGDININQYIK